MESELGISSGKQSFEAQPKINPEITKNFIADISAKAERGVYRVEVMVGNKILPIDVYPGVFPPKSDYSVSSRSVYEAFGNLEGKRVADIGSGSGIESIVASLAGAEHVDASDVNTVAVECTKHNVELNGLGDAISVYAGSLFEAFPRGTRYDLIIANLPIVDFPSDARTDIAQALYDPDFSIHKSFLNQAKDYLSERGEVTFTHANLQSGKTERPDQDFEILERMITEYGYEITERKKSEAFGYQWINYKIKVR